MKTDIYSQQGKVVGSTELKPEVFEVEPCESLVHQYVVNYLARQRQGNAATRTRSDVRGGGRKPWRQKGTGRARAGTIRSPLWRGGGIVFGPHPRLYGNNMPKVMKRKAIRACFTDKAQAERIKVLDKIEFEAVRTKSMVSLLTTFDLDGSKCLLLDEGVNRNLTLSCRNLGKVKYSRASLANGYDILNADWLLVTAAGLKKLHEVFG